MKTQIKAIFFLSLFLLSSYSIGAQAGFYPGIIGPSEASQGQLIFAGIAMPDGVSAREIRGKLVFSDGSASPYYPAFSPEARSINRDERQMLKAEEALIIPAGYYKMAFLSIGVPDWAATGIAELSIELPGFVTKTMSINILKTGFKSETLHLDPVLTSIRADPDPKKDEEARRYQEILGTVNYDANYLKSGFIRPVKGERKTSFYGDRRIYAYSNGTSAKSVHYGIDYGYPTGTPIYACGDGKVVMAEARIVTGLTVIIEHLPAVFTIYMHLSEFRVEEGQMVRQGDEIGLIGATGLATGPHLHWELRVSGVACDPESIIGVDKFPDIRILSIPFEGR